MAAIRARIRATPAVAGLPGRRGAARARSTCGCRRSPAAGRVFNLLGLSPVIAIVVGVRRYRRPASPGPWRWFAIGFLLFWLGDLYTYSYPRLTGAEVPFPSLGDAAYVARLPGADGGAADPRPAPQPGARPRRGDRLADHHARPRADLVDRADPPSLHDEELSTVAKLVSIAYPIGDILLLAAAIRLAVDTGARRPAFYLLVVEHRRPARHRLRLRPGHARRRLRRPGLARRRLDQLLPAVGRGRAAPVDARARARRARSATPRLDAAAPRAAHRAPR